MSGSEDIGGFLALELRDGGLPYPHAFPINSGRSGLELIVRHRGYRRIWLPAYVCKAVYDTLEDLGVEAVPYALTPDLDPVETPSLSAEEGFLYVNYFGIKDNTCDSLSARVKNIILDLTQAFFHEPPQGIDGFNSVRKFVGVPDGAYVFGNFVAGLSLSRATSWPYCEHLLRRLDGDVLGGYSAFKANDAAVGNWSPHKMSIMTERLLRAIDLNMVKQKRIANYQHLHAKLKAANELIIAGSSAAVPLCYPYLARNGSALRKKLIENRIFVPTYWPDIDDRLAEYKTEINLKTNLVCLPIDQRYGIKEMDVILDALRQEGVI